MVSLSLSHRFTSLFQPRPRAGIGVGGGGGDSICDNCIDNICFFGNDMYIMSDIAHMLKIHQVKKYRVTHQVFQNLLLILI